MYAVICLGNPGERYERTWHNAAWIVADTIVPISAWEFNKYANAKMAIIDDVLWVKPQTYMNTSGEVLPYLKQQYGITNDELVVIYDDLDLPLGSMKIAHNRGEGGHNGLQSIIAHMGTKAFTRIRIGIAPKEGREAIVGDFRDYVLRPMPDIALESMRQRAKVVSQMVQTIATDGYDAAMNKYNEG